MIEVIKVCSKDGIETAVPHCIGHKLETQYKCMKCGVLYDVQEMAEKCHPPKAT